MRIEREELQVGASKVTGLKKDIQDAEKAYLGMSFWIKAGERSVGWIKGRCEMIDVKIIIVVAVMVFGGIALAFILQYFFGKKDKQADSAKEVFVADRTLYVVNATNDGKSERRAIRFLVSNKGKIEIYQSDCDLIFSESRMGEIEIEHQLSDVKCEVLGAGRVKVTKIPIDPRNKKIDIFGDKAGSCSNSIFDDIDEASRINYDSINSSV
ncbi:hypothetical protein [Chrysiogenes arsenatis]|uniref:hypothetical protein n=1 Tax=Chrysiogenes arsenatis TaxID=309797 RepID=UPI00041C5BA7|nr:hypothetical protein [Chrysiogenes arsenatis]